MIGYVTVGSNDLEKSRSFYDALMPVLGANRIMEFGDNFTMYGTGMGKPGFAVCKPYNGNAATVGNGNMTKSALDALAAQAKKGIVCVRSSRVVTGNVGRNVEVDDDKLGLIASLDHNPQKSRVLLRLALLKTTDLKTIQRYFDEY